MERKEEFPGVTEDQLIFALDIGTRSVIGMVGVWEEASLRILASETEEYQNRAVVDGQIENIEETAKTAGVVKRRLEERLAMPLKGVYIAAAGRTLKTQTGECALELDGAEADEAFLARLEAGAVGAARDALFSGTDEDEAGFFCTGHSVVRYELDNYEMSTLLGHRGKLARVQVIATFLPREVVESLYATMQRIGLTVSGLTLEPIAAMNAVIPADIRMLNLALADIGAGTSDIAVCDDGCVCAYTMATIAGDEVTECLMRQYLVDFATAEEIKRTVAWGQSTVSFENILGMHVDEPAERVMEKLQPVLCELSDEICKRILEVNGKPPAAVFLTGGGSQIPGLCEMVSEGLSMEGSRVTVGGSNYMKKTIVSDCNVFTSEYVTPVGIALTAASGQGADIFTVTINGRKLRFVNNWDMTLLDTLLLSGVKYSQIIGHTGKSITFDLNGERRVTRGQAAAQAAVSLNGENASLSDTVHPGDVIEFQPAQAGPDAQVMLSQIVEDFQGFPVFLNGVETPVGTVVTINGVRVTEDVPIRNMDTILCQTISTVGDLCEQMDLQPEHIAINGQPVEGVTPLKNGDELHVTVYATQEHPEPPAPAYNIPSATLQPEVPHPVVPVPTVESSIPPAEDMPSRGMGVIHIMLNGRSMEVSRRPDGSIPQFIDLFNYVDIDPKNPQGEIVLRLNGRDASYLDVVTEGDRAEIFWNKETIG